MLVPEEIVLEGRVDLVVMGWGGGVWCWYEINIS